VVFDIWELEKARHDMGHDLKLENKQDDPLQWNKSKIIFCDLDGVLVDFCEGVRMIFLKQPHEIPANTLWPRLARIPNFYTNLPWMEDGRRLWDSIKHLNPTILTAAPRGSWAKSQKIEWVRRNLGPDVPVIVTTGEKQKHCPPANPYAILIDDRRKCCKPWEEAGGTAIMHKNTEETIRALVELGVSIDLSYTSSYHW
jgi:hypothetical protein